MRCATVTPIYGFSTASGTTRKTFTGLTVGAELPAGSICPAGQLVVIDPDQWAAAASYSSFTDLSLAEAGQVALAVMLVWSVGWAFRMLIKAVNSSADSVSQSES